MKGWHDPATGFDLDATSIVPVSFLQKQPNDLSEGKVLASRPLLVESRARNPHE
jgi:hypothetical protein